MNPASTHARGAVLWTAAATALLTAFPSRADLIRNGSFESALVADGSFQALAPASWSGGAVLMNPDAAGHFVGNPFAWPQAQAGAQFENIGNTSQFALSQALSVASAGAYRLGWFDNTALRIVPGFQTSPYRVALEDSGGTPVLNLSLDAYDADGLWNARSVLTSLAIGTYTLRFTAIGQPNGTDTLIDAVSLDAAPPNGQLPLPSSAALLGAALLGAAAARRRRKN